MVDTGSQVTVIDPALASELHPKPQGTVGLVSAAGYATASVTPLDTLEAKSHLVEKPLRRYPGPWPDSSRRFPHSGCSWRELSGALRPADRLCAHKLLCLRRDRGDAK